MKFIVMFCASVALPTTAVAQPTLDYVSRFSLVEIEGTLPGAPSPDDYYAAFQSSADLDPFDQLLADSICWDGLTAGSDASQVSMLGPTGLSAVGSSHMEVLSTSGTGTGTAWASSAFEVVFDLSEAAPIELSGWVQTPPGCGPPADLGCAVRFFQQAGASWTELYAALYEQPITFTADLAPGRYRLETEAFVEGDTAMAYEFPIMASTSYNVTLQIVPEPASLVLVLAPACVMRRRRR